MTEILWLTVDQNPGMKKVAKYKRTFGAVDGKVAFVPAWVSGYEGNTVLMCASFDGARIATHGNRVYFDASWMQQEYPSSAGAIMAAQESLSIYLDRRTK